MFAFLFILAVHGFILDSVFIGDEVNCSGTLKQNLFIQLVLPCESWDSDLEVGPGHENFFLAWSSTEYETDVVVEIGDNNELEDVFEIGSDLDAEEFVSPGDYWLIIGDVEAVDTRLEAKSHEITPWLHFEVFEEYHYLLLIDCEDDCRVVDTLDLSTLDDGSFVAKRNYPFLNTEYDDAIADCNGNAICEDDLTWGEVNDLWPQYVDASWTQRDPALCTGSAVEQDLEIPAEACREDAGEEDEDEVVVVADSPTSSPTTAAPTTAPTKDDSSQANVNAGSSTSSGDSSSFTSTVWFFIILFVAGMALCGFVMKFCRRTSSADDGFIAAADYLEGALGEQRGSLIMMQPVKKNLAMMDGENAHFDEDGLGNTPSASRVRESRIIRQREGESDQLEGLPTGHQIIKASSIPSGSERSRDSKRSPGSSEVGEIDISSLE